MYRLLHVQILLTDFRTKFGFSRTLPLVASIVDVLVHLFLSVPIVEAWEAEVATYIHVSPPPPDMMTPQACTNWKGSCLMRHPDHDWARSHGHLGKS